MFLRRGYFSRSKQVGKIADFAHNEGKGFGNRAARPHTIVLGVTPPALLGTCTEEYRV